MIKLQDMRIYRSLHNHYVIPFYRYNDGDWLCKVFYFDTDGDHIYDQGYYRYSVVGKCIYEPYFHDLWSVTSLNKIDKNLADIIIDWKNFIKKERKTNNEYFKSLIRTHTTSNKPTGY